MDMEMIEMLKQIESSVLELLRANSNRRFRPIEIAARLDMPPQRQKLYDVLYKLVRKKQIRHDKQFHLFYYRE